MKNIFVLIFIFFNTVVFSQKTYSFDFFAKYSIKVPEKGLCSEHLVYYNTDNFNYALFINGNQKTRLYGRLIDFEKRLLHKYTIVQSGKGKDIVFSFKHKESEYLSRGNDFFRNYFPVFENHTLTLYQNKRKKNIVDIVDFDYVKANKNLFPVFRIAAYHPLEYKSEVDPRENVMVKSAKFYDKNRELCKEVILDEYKNIALDLNVPAR